MKRLFEIVVENAEKSKELSILRKEFKDKETKILAEIAELKRLAEIAEQGFDVIRIQLAESVLDVRGNPYGITDQRDAPIAGRAIIDIAQNAQYLRKGFYGNKRYDGYYQESSHPYGYGPKHGSVVDEVGLKREARERDLTDDEKDACIYYLNNYVAIKNSKNKV